MRVLERRDGLLAEPAGRALTPGALWEEAFALVRGAAPHFLPLRTLGWDIAITPDGPMIIEANAHWGAEVTSRMGRWGPVPLPGGAR